MRGSSNPVARWLDATFRRGTRFASPQLVFLSVALVIALQLPAQLLMRAGHISAGVLANEIVAVAGVPLALAAILCLSMREVFPFRPAGAAMIFALLAFMAGADVVMDYATAASEYFFPLPLDVGEAMDRMMAATTPAEIAWKFAVLCIVPAFCEEIFFRGFCQGSLAARWGNARAVVIAAAIFAAMHGNVHYMHLYFLLGLAFGFAYAATGSLWAAVACHLYNNAWTFVNHVVGTKLPVGGRSLLPDAAIFIAGTCVACGAAMFVASRMKRSETH
jgi:membrane protease YdiL (CAAX protease family)